MKTKYLSSEQLQSYNYEWVTPQFKKERRESDWYCAGTFRKVYKEDQLSRLRTSTIAKIVLTLGLYWLFSEKCRKHLKIVEEGEKQYTVMMKKDEFDDYCEGITGKGNPKLNYALGMIDQERECYEDALKRFEAAGDADGQYRRALLIRHQILQKCVKGEKIEEATAKLAISSLKAAADQNHAAAQFVLGELYRHGTSYCPFSPLRVGKDVGLAHKYYEQAAELGHTLAQKYLKSQREMYAPFSEIFGDETLIEKAPIYYPEKTPYKFLTPVMKGINEEGPFVALTVVAADPEAYFDKYRKAEARASLLRQSEQYTSRSPQTYDKRRETEVDDITNERHVILLQQHDNGWIWTNIEAEVKGTSRLSKEELSNSVQSLLKGESIKDKGDNAWKLIPYPQVK